MSLPTVANAVPRIYEDDVESDFIREELLAGLADMPMSPTLQLAYSLMFERVPVCIVECFEVP